MNRNLIITLLFLTNIAAPMIAMDGSDPKITALLQQPRDTKCLNEPIDDRALLGANPLWQTAHSWSQEEKNKLLGEAMQFPHNDPRVALAVAIGADPNYENERSRHSPWTTALTRASRFSDYRLVQYLLEKNADPNQTAKPSGLCPLQCATTTKMAELLIVKGAIIPRAILHSLQTEAREDLMAFYLLKMRVRPEQDELGVTPLHITTPFWTTWMEDRLCKAQVLIKAGVDLCAQTKGGGGNTALHCAALGKDVLREAYIQAEPLDISDQICSAIINGCKERHQGYQEHFTLLCCLKRIKSGLYDQRDLCRARFGWRSQDKISPFQLLSIKNNDRQTPFQLWPENEELNPEKYKPVQNVKKE